MSFEETLLFTMVFVVFIFLGISFETAKVLKVDSRGFVGRQLPLVRFVFAAPWIVLGLIFAFFLSILFSALVLTKSESSSLLFLISESKFIILLFLLMLSFFIFYLLLVCDFFKGRLNGGSDAMLFQVLLGLFLSFLGALSDAELGKNLREAGLIWIATQVTLSYFMAGMIKARNPRWWRGVVLQEILQAPIYSVPLFMRKLGWSYKSMVPMSVGLIVFEVTFPLVWIFPKILLVYFVLGLIFHFGVWWALGLHRFFWVWTSTYPALAFAVFWIHEKIY